MNKYLKIGLWTGGALLAGGGLIYGYQSYRIAKNLEYRPEINFPQSRLSLDKLTLAVDLVLTNSTPNSLTLTKPTITVRYGVGDNAVKFTSIPSNERFTLSGMGQIRIPNIPIEIIFSDLASIGFDILDKLKKCQEIELYVDVATQVDGWVFIAKKDAKVIKFTRDNIPSRLANLIPCDPKKSQITNLLSQGLKQEAITSITNLDTFLPSLSAENQVLNANLNIASDPSFMRSGATKSINDLIAERALQKQLTTTDYSSYNQETGARTAVATQNIANADLTTQIQNAIGTDYAYLGLDPSIFSNLNGLGCAGDLGCGCNAMGII